MLPSPHQKVDAGEQVAQGHGWPKGPLGAMRCVLLSPGPEGSVAWVAQGDEMAPWAQGTGERWTAWSFWFGKRMGKPCRVPRPGPSPVGVHHHRVWPQVLRLPGAQTMTPLPCHHAEQAFRWPLRVGGWHGWDEDAGRSGSVHSSSLMKCSENPLEAHLDGWGVWAPPWESSQALAVGECLVRVRCPPCRCRRV